MEPESVLQYSQEAATGPLSWARWIQFTHSPFHLISVRSVLVMSSHQQLGLSRSILQI